MSGRFHVRALTFRRWEEQFGDPREPSSVLDIGVERTLCSRAAPASALVKLTDRRLALTGAVVITGPAGKLLDHLRHQHAHAAEAERQWLADCIELLRRERSRDRTDAVSA
jgi:hypothetical protein